MPDIPVIIGGYSLGALFALWSAYSTNRFAAVAAASPSVWYPGWIDYVKGKKIGCRAVYLSLGDREEKAKNPVMARVGDCIREQFEALRGDSVLSVLEWNEGGHFKDAEKRTARAFSWCLSALEGSNMN